MKRIFTLLVGIFSVLVLNAQTSEDFNYTSTGSSTTDTLTNPALGGATWKRHSGTGGAITWSATGLTYAGYSGSGIGGAVSFAHASGSREDANMPIWDSIKTGSVYASFLINVTVSGGTTGDYGVHFVAGNGTSPGSDFKARLFFKDGSTAGSFKFGLSKGSSATSAVFTTTEYTIGQTYLVVLKYAFNSGTSIDDAVSAYIFTSGVPSTEPASADLVATDMTIADIAKIYGFAIRQGTSGTGAATLDGIKIGTTWSGTLAPLSLKSFSGSLINGAANLNWLTASEVNVDGFAIEKSVDGKNFYKIDFVSAKNTNEAAYSYTDVSFKEASYYRLKMIDKDGKFQYSKVIAISPKQSVKLEIFPNPAINNITVTHEKATDNAAVKVVTVDGRTILSQNIKSGATQSTIDVSKLVKGNYLLIFVNNNNNSSIQFIKQ